MTRMPERGAQVQLRDQQGGAHRSDVLDRQQDGPGVLVLSAPADLPADQPYPPGTRLLVSWPEDNAYWVLPVVLVDLRPADDRPLLVVEVDDDAWREERRQYARSALAASVHLDFETEDEHGQPGPTAIPAELIDLSEVALRGVVASELREWFQPRIPVTVKVSLAGDRFDIPATVLLAKPAARLDLGLEVVILFDRPVPRVDELRAHLNGVSERG